jgi:hypothetical protein
MVNEQLVYELQEDDTRNEMTFFFISKGETDIIKAIQYSFVQDLNGRHLFNLGFGDYDLENDKIRDDIDSNNNDVYKVFNTVMSTIPLFFEKHKNDYLIVNGSDGHKDFISQCILDCIKKCTSECKKFNRRITVYRGYVDKNYESLCTDYQFFGGIKDEFGNVTFDSYERHKKYDSVLLLNKKL